GDGDQPTRLEDSRQRTQRPHVIRYVLQHFGQDHLVEIFVGEGGIVQAAVDQRDAVQTGQRAAGDLHVVELKRQPDDLRAACRADEAGVEAAPASCVEDAVTLLRVKPVEDGLYAAAVGHVGLVGYHPPDRLLIGHA